MEQNPCPDRANHDDANDIDDDDEDDDDNNNDTNDDDNDDDDEQGLLQNKTELEMPCSASTKARKKFATKNLNLLHTGGVLKINTDGFHPSWLPSALGQLRIGSE